MMEQETHTIKFAGGLTCSVKVPIEAPEPGGWIPVMEWNRPVKNYRHIFWKKIFPNYKEWVIGLCDTVAKRWNVKLMHVFQLSSNSGECWLFAPDHPPKHVQLQEHP